MIISNTDIGALCTILKRSGQKIVLTNGCFDIIHPGHIKYLTKAASYGDCLVVGLNTDASVKKWKDEKRPIIAQAERAAVLDALKPVDYVTFFAEMNASDLVGKVRPDIYVKGGDYTLDTLPERHALQECNAIVKFIPTVAGCSTTNIIEKIKEVYKK